MKLRRFEATLALPRPAGMLLEFFADPRNAERMTPPFLNFSFAGAPPERIVRGVTIEYRLRIYRVAVRWITLVEAYEPPSRFAYVQLKGPYALWRHTVACEAIGPRDTRVRDMVEYAMPLGPAGAIAHAVFAGRAIRRVFDFRAAELSRMFSGAAES